MWLISNMGYVKLWGFAGHDNLNIKWTNGVWLISSVGYVKLWGYLGHDSFNIRWTNSMCLISIVGFIKLPVIRVMIVYILSGQVVCD